MTAYYELVEDRHVAPALLRAREQAMQIGEREMNLWRSSYLDVFRRTCADADDRSLRVRSRFMRRVLFLARVASHAACRRAGWPVARVYIRDLVP